MGRWHLSQERLAVDGDVNDWHFLLQFVVLRLLGGMTSNEGLVPCAA